MVQVLQGQHIREATEPLDGESRTATHGLVLSAASVVLLALVVAVYRGSAWQLVTVVGLVLALATGTLGTVLGHVAWRSARRRHDLPFGRTVAALVVGYLVAVPGWLVVVDLTAALVL